MEKLTKFVNEHMDDDTIRLIFDKDKYIGIDMELAVNCIESRRKLKGKVQEWYDNPELVFPLKLSAEQCSSSATASFKAETAAEIASLTSGKDWTVADLTGGLGVDSWKFSQKASKVMYCEMQKALCDAARHNFTILGADNIEVFNHTAAPGICLDFIKDSAYPDIVYMDPARRSESGKKVFLIEDCTPDVLTLKDEIFSHCRNILLKLSPMADISMVCDRLGKTCRKVYAVASGGECKELLIWMDREWSGETEISAVELHRNSPASILTFTQGEEKAAGAAFPEASVNSYSFLFEPGKALMKTGAFNIMSERFRISKLGISTHYYLTDEPDKATLLEGFGKVFRIVSCRALDKKSLKETGKEFPMAEVTARNIPMDTENLRKRMGVRSGDEYHIFGLKSDSEGNLLIVTKRL